MEQEQKHFPFVKLLRYLLSGIKVIENEREMLASRCPDFNVMDAFRGLDQAARGQINSIEFVSGLL